MKYNLRCVLFGHKFWGRRAGSNSGYGINETWVEEMKNCCVKCGLTKAECGITTQPNDGIRPKTDNINI